MTLSSPDTGYDKTFQVTKSKLSEKWNLHQQSTWSHDPRTPLDYFPNRFISQDNKKYPSGNWDALVYKQHTNFHGLRKK